MSRGACAIGEDHSIMYIDKRGFHCISHRFSIVGDPTRPASQSMGICPVAVRFLMPLATAGMPSHCMGGTTVGTVQMARVAMPSKWLHSLLDSSIFCVRSLSH